MTGIAPRRPGPFSRRDRDWTATPVTAALVLVVVSYVRLRALWEDAGHALRSLTTRVRFR